MNHAPVSTFLLRHQGEIARSSLIAESLIVEFRSDISRERVLDLMADLITTCNPISAHVIKGNELRVTFDG